MARCAHCARSRTAMRPTARHCCNTLLRSATLAAALGLAACATVPGPGPAPVPAPQPVPADREPPAPNVNLSGFPLPYRQGYADGCASATGAERKDAARFAGDGNYRMGWQDGSSLCRKR
jgi:hypothetical protein